MRRRTAEADGNRTRQRRGTPPRFSQCAAADGNDAWIVSTHPARLFSRSQAITALTLAERLAVGYGDSDPFVMSWRKELGALLGRKGALYGGGRRRPRGLQRSAAAGMSQSGGAVTRRVSESACPGGT